MDFLKSVDTWFLIVAVALLFGFFVWAVQYILSGIKDSIVALGVTFKSGIDELKNCIEDLYEHKNDHESRITALETRCDIQHGEFPIQRQGHGRRKTDRPYPPPPASK